MTACHVPEAGSVLDQASIGMDKNARSGIRTHTEVNLLRILSPVRLPIPPSGHKFFPHETWMQKLPYVNSRSISRLRQDSSWVLTGAASTISALVRTFVPNDSIQENTTIPASIPQSRRGGPAPFFGLAPLNLPLPGGTPGPEPGLI